MTEDYLEFQGRPGHIEKRFPVDRKKLEKLITGELVLDHFEIDPLPLHPFPLLPFNLSVGGRNNETAEEFFKRVQDTTGTLILWPSRLKIGAKSKKGVMS